MRNCLKNCGDAVMVLYKRAKGNGCFILQASLIGSFVKSDNVGVE